MTMVDDLRILIDADHDSHPAEIAAVYAELRQEEAAARACRLAIRAIRSDGRLSKRARQLAEAHVRAAEAGWWDAPALTIVVEEQEDEEAARVARR